MMITIDEAWVGARRFRLFYRLGLTFEWGYFAEHESARQWGIRIEFSPYRLVLLFQRKV